MNVLLGLKIKTRMASMTVLLLLLSTGLAFGQKYVALSFNLVLGWESLTNVLGRKASNPLIGINPSQGLYFIPKNNTGFVAGISLCENLSSSKIYGRDIGVRLMAGVKL